MRFIKLDSNNKVISIRYGQSIVPGEIQSDTGELGQRMQEDGTFVDDTTTIEPSPTQLDEIQNTVDLILFKQEGII